ncbi:glycoside hydrolase family 51 protein [Peniophora sp. CONT]|nr:glycoside hydrolase family 51 protein [Peniophora sp. CONT]
MVLALGVAFLASSLLQPSSAQTTVIVNGTASHDIAPTLWGLMYEDISHSGDGGLYAELLQNRAFQQVTPGNTSALYAWAPIGSADLTVVADAVSSALPNALELTITAEASDAGVGNLGYWGIPVNSSWTYNASFFYRFPTTPSSAVNATVGLQSSSGESFGSSSVSLKPTTEWTQVNLTLTPTSSASDTNNNFTLTFSNFTGTVHLGLFSLFPPTWGEQENGMRSDIAQALKDLGPSFFRWPGGNNLEGQSIPTRWQWNATLGPLSDRPGREGDWSYINTDGLGVYEYLVWVELMGMQNIMAVWAGYSLDGSSVEEDALGPYIEQARQQQIEFAVGNTSTPNGALRASLGHPEPFEVHYVEVGNEDFFSTTYTYRWTAFLTELQADYPDIRFLATSYIFNPILDPVPQSYDSHVYDTPTWFAQNSIMYDGFERNGTTYFEGEYAAISTNSSNIFGTPEEGRFVYPIVSGSISEAAFMMGLERNSDIVFAASYAPLLGHVTENQWTPNLITFDAGNVYKSTSYYVQQLFSLNRGDSYLPTTPTHGDPNGTVFWSVVSQDSPSAYIIKVANTDISSVANVIFQFPAAVSAQGTLVQLSGPANASNTPDTPDAVVPVSSTIDVAQTLEFSAPALSLSVITVPLA